MERDWLNFAFLIFGICVASPYSLSASDFVPRASELTMRSTSDNAFSKAVEPLGVFARRSIALRAGSLSYILASKPYPPPTPTSAGLVTVPILNAEPPLPGSQRRYLSGLVYPVAHRRGKADRPRPELLPVHPLRVRMREP